MTYFNSKDYPGINDVIKDALAHMYMTGQPIYGYPIILTALIIEHYSLERNDDVMMDVLTYIEKYCAKFFSKTCDTFSDVNIVWKNNPGIKKLIWDKAVTLANDETEPHEVVQEIGELVLNKNHDVKCELWLGAYIAEVVDIIYKFRPECQLEFQLYHYNPFVYRGKIEGSEEWWYSEEADGLMDGDRVFAYFLPHTVCINTELYDDSCWDDLSPEEQDIEIERHNVPAELIRYMPDVWRGNPIYTNDVIKLDWFNGEEIVESHIGIYIEEGDSLFLKLLDTKERIKDDKLETAHITILGNVFDNADFANLYETTLTSELFSD